ncbi:MAG: hypothetical protein J6S67_17670 [Methanobrevibacter sp.]|nr:hypothetical protein [Methanobrevibacter sp.]
MVKNLISYNGNAEYSVDLHLNEMKLSKEKVMFITVTKVDNGMDYTVVFNGLPMPKQLNKACGRDDEAAQLIIKTLKEDAVKYAIEYWNFGKSEWEDELENSLNKYLKITFGE